MTMSQTFVEDIWPLKHVMNVNRSQAPNPILGIPPKLLEAMPEKKLAYIWTPHSEAESGHHFKKKS